MSSPRVYGFGVGSTIAADAVVVEPMRVRVWGSKGRGFGDGSERKARRMFVEPTRVRVWGGANRKGPKGYS